MAYIDNSETKRELDEAVRGNPNTNLTPSQLTNTVQPVIDINPKSFRRSSLLASFTRSVTGTNVSVLVADTRRETYITAITLSSTSDVLCDNGIITVNATFDEVGAGFLIRTVNNPLTLNERSIHLNFSYPIKITKGSAITFTGIFAAGTLTTAMQIFGYKV